MRPEFTLNAGPVFSGRSSAATDGTTTVPPCWTPARCGADESPEGQVDGVTATRRIVADGRVSGAAVLTTPGAQRSADGAAVEQLRVGGSWLYIVGQ